MAEDVNSGKHCLDRTARFSVPLQNELGGFTLDTVKCWTGIPKQVL